jgi:hypothetical protein
MKDWMILISIMVSANLYCQIPPSTIVVIELLNDDSLMTETISINKLDSEGLRQGFWIDDYKTYSIHLEFVLFKDGVLVNYAKFGNNGAISLINTLYLDSNTTYYSYDFYKENGNVNYVMYNDSIICSGRYKNGLKRGYWIYKERDSGKMMRQEKYRKGELVSFEEF